MCKRRVVPKPLATLDWLVLETKCLNEIERRQRISCQNGVRQDNDAVKTVQIVIYWPFTFARFASNFNKPDFPLFGFDVFALAGDGCLQDAGVGKGSGVE